MKNIDVFIENFNTAIKIKDSVNESELKSKAMNVINAVNDYGKTVMAGQSLVNYFFADHGWAHSERLSHYALFMMKHLKKEHIEQFNNEIWSNMLILLWTAIALHDIGMNDIAENEEELIEVIIQQVGRIEHVRKSGEWISRIADHIEEKSKENEDIGKFINAWEDYWNEEQLVDSVTALRMVKDIVLMHGENENWLVEGKIGALDRNIFMDIDESLKDNYIKIISFNEAILCLIDLLDICPERMNIFSNEGLNKYFERLDQSKKRITFEHWVSHNITIVNCNDYDKDGYIRLDMRMYSMDSKMYLNNPLYNIYPYLGAVEACLKWGNDERLKNILNEDFGYKGIKLGFYRQDVRVWNKINNKAKEFKIFKTDHIFKINNQLGGISNVFVTDLISKWIEKKWHIEKSINYYHEFRSIFDLIKSGASLHLLYDKQTRKIDARSTGFFVDLSDKSEMMYDINDALLAAINIFYEICSSRNGIKEIQIITKGDDKFSSLYNGTNADRDTAFIIIVRNYFEDDLNKIIETVQRKNDGSFVIFSGMEHRLIFNLKSDCQYIEFILNKEEFNKIKVILNEYALKHWANKEKANTKEIKQFEELLKNRQFGIGRFVKQLKIIYNGIQAINEKIVTDLASDRYSSLFILDLFEMMSKNKKGKREINKEDLKYFYNEFCAQNRSRIYQMDDFETAIYTLRSLCEEYDGDIVLIEKYSDSFDNLIISSSREMKYDIKKNLFQMMIFFWLYNYRKVNFKSVCYREYLTYLSPEQLCGYIYNTNIALTERINIAFETSEIIVDDLRLNINNEVLRIFVNEYIGQLLIDKNQLIENEDIICFQSIYRVFRGILVPDMEECIDFIINIIKTANSPVGFLGFIEGVCSANLNENEKISNMVNCYLEQVLDEIFKSSDHSIKYMAYDILYNYEKNNLREKYKIESWENICASLHFKDELKKENENSIYFAWKRMREKFIYIINETSKSIRKRNIFKNDMGKKV